jgi:uncharacterized protein YutE (UPF0331/DUF86 family)
MPLNHELIERKISLILQDLEQLRELAKLDLSQYLEDFKNEILAERYLERILDRDSAVRYAKLAGLRNRLAHEYNGIDEKMIYKALKELPPYIEAVKNYIR